eukprot:gene8435-11412_t
MKQNGLESFVIYRPNVSSGRLEGNYFNYEDNRWKPSLSYKYSLNEIQNQLTPAESYRLKLATSGKEIRAIQRLETRIHRSWSKFNAAALKLQSIMRGRWCRWYFLSIKDNLVKQKKYRDAKSQALNFFYSNNFVQVVVVLSLYSTEDMVLIRMQALYKLKNFRGCIDDANIILEIDELNEDAYYIKACALSKLDMYEDAFSVLKLLSALIVDPKDSVYKLNSFVATKLIPPRFNEAIDSLDYLISRNKNNYDLYLQRAACYNCLQEWSLSLRDLDYVLLFNPSHTQAILFRARLYSCIRHWDNAIENFETVLKYEPSNVDACNGLDDLTNKYVLLPMISPRIINGE